MKKYNIKNIILTLFIIGLITTFIILSITHNEKTTNSEEKTTNQTYSQNNKQEEVSQKTTEKNTEQPQQYEANYEPEKNLQPIRKKVTALLGETTVEILDYTRKLILTSNDNIQLKYDPTIAKVNAQVKAGKVWVSITPLKDENFIVNLYYKDKLIGFLDVSVINHKLVSVSNSYIVEVNPYTPIMRTFTFTVKNEYNVKHTIQIKALNPSNDLQININPTNLTLNPGQRGTIKVEVKGIIKEYTVTITLSIDGVERYIMFKTKPLLLDVELLDNTVIAGQENQLTFNIHTNTNINFYLYLNDVYIKELNLKEGDNKVTIPYNIPLPQGGTCYLNLVNKYGTIKLTLKNPFKEFNYYFNLKIMTNNPITIETGKSTLTFYNSTSDSTIIIFKNNNNYNVTLTPHYFICNTPTTELDKCTQANNYIISFYEVTGQETGKITLKPYQQKLYEITVKPRKMYYEDFEKYLLITFTAEKTVNNETLPMNLNNIIVLKIINKVNIVKAGINVQYTYNETTGGHIKTVITSPIDIPLKNVSVTYWVKGYDGDNFVMVRDKITLQLNEFSNTYTLMISLPKGYKFFIYYIEVKGEKIEGSKLLYLYFNS